jgi:hypothetical protein
MTIPHPAQSPASRWPRTLAAAAVLAFGILAVSLLTSTSTPVSAAPPLVAGGTLTACNGEQNAGGVGVRCTVTVTNYMTATGTLAPAAASSWTVTRCTGATGVLAPVLLGGATCVTTTLPTTGAPISIVQQCNGSGNGGGGVVWCTTAITNYFAAPPAAFTAGTVFDCIPTAPGMLCAPTALANTALNVPASTIGQCNGSGGGGGLVPAVPLLSAHCAVGPGSTTTGTAPMNVDQCNGSANGGGAVLKCLATVTNFAAPPPNDDDLSTPTPPLAVAAPVAAAVPVATAVAAPVATAVVVPAAPVTPAVVVPVVAPPVPTPVAPQQVIPTPTVTPLPAPTPPAPRPGPTGNRGPGTIATSTSGWLIGVLALALAGTGVLIRRRLVTHRS